MIPSMRRDSIAGPIFVSIGEGDQLSMFLSKNPNMPKDLMLVDDYSNKAFKQIGIGLIAEKQELAIKGSKNMKAPKLSASQWMSYLGIVNKLAPFPKKLTLQIPEGVRRLGATFAIRGDDVLYVYEDGVPGDHPNPEDVLKSFEISK